MSESKYHTQYLKSTSYKRVKKLFGFLEVDGEYFDGLGRVVKIISDDSTGFDFHEMKFTGVIDNRDKRVFDARGIIRKIISEDKVIYQEDMSNYEQEISSIPSVIQVKDFHKYTKFKYSFSEWFIDSIDPILKSEVSSETRMKFIEITFEIFKSTPIIHLDSQLDKIADLYRTVGIFQCQH